jgi:hypothetical protein
MFFAQADRTGRFRRILARTRIDLGNMIDNLEQAVWCRLSCRQ